MDSANRKPRHEPQPAVVELLTGIGHAAGRPPTANTNGNRGWLRLPGLFRRWEFEQVIDVDQEFLVEESGRDEQGMSLFAIFTRPQILPEGTP